MIEVDLEGGRNLYTYLKIYQVYTSNFLKKRVSGRVER